MACAARAARRARSRGSTPPAPPHARRRDRPGRPRRQTFNRRWRAMNASLLTVEIRTEQDVVLARQRARHVAGLLGFTSQEQTSIATAVSEIARNAFRYAGRG